MAANKGAKTLVHAQDAARETTPLLNASGRIDRSETVSIGSSHATKSPQTSEPPSPSTTQPDDEKPFPLNQILILCYASVVEPIAYFIIFPYISEMVERVGGEETENVGYWVGTIESSFSLVQMLFTIFYGRLADRLGRKPVMVFSIAGIGVASALFGLSTTLWQMVAFRCLAGLFSGSSVTIRAMLSEICTKKTQAKAFAWFMFAR
jgi:predicted MFS family arabinose efflux permease